MSVVLPPIKYFPNVIKDPNSIFTTLETLDWEHRDAPRQEYYCNDVPADYTYGEGRGKRTYSPKPWTDAIMMCRFILEALTDTKYEVCFLNRYLDQKDQLGWHADNSPEMDDARPIGIISFGVEREIWFRENLKNTAVPVHKQVLGNGSICVMSPGMQDTWQHRIPKASFLCGGRISLTFRGYVNAVQQL